MPVDKLKDTSVKKPIAENKIVEAKPESSTKTENKSDTTPKKQGMGGVRSRCPKPTGQLERDFWAEESDRACRLLHGGFMPSRQFYVVVR